MKITVKNQPTEIKNEMDKIVSYLEILGYKGKIKFKLEQKVINAEKLSLFDKWQRYVSEASFLEPESYISQWSPNNGSEIGQKRETNEILRVIIQRWYDYSNRYETINMLDILYDFFEDFEYAELSYEESDLRTFIIEHGFDETLRNISSFEGSDLKKDFVAIIEIFLDRNPKFRNDW